MKLFLSVIIPMYNEEANLRRGVLQEVADYLGKQKFSYEVIISDDGSTDESKAMVEDFLKKDSHFQLLSNPHGGKPFAIWEGIKKAKGEVCLFTDMDQSTPIEELDKLLPYFAKGCSLVIGSRGIGRKNFPLYRKLGGLVFRVFRQALLLRRIGDTQCGFKAFKTEVVREVFPKLQFFSQKEKPKGWRVTSYDVELLYLLTKRGYQIAEVPVNWLDRDISVGKGGNPLIKYLKESWEMVMEILQVKLNDLRGAYDEE